MENQLIYICGQAVVMVLPKSWFVRLKIWKRGLPKGGKPTKKERVVLCKKFHFKMKTVTPFLQRIVNNFREVNVNDFSTQAQPAFSQTHQWKRQNKM